MRLQGLCRRKELAARRPPQFPNSLSLGEIPSTCLGPPSERLTRDVANSLASFLRSSAQRLLQNRDDHEKAEVELTLIDYVSRLKTFGQTPSSKPASLEPLRLADHLVKTMVSSGLLRNRSNLRQALLLGLDATLPHWIPFCKTRVCFAVGEEWPRFACRLKLFTSKRVPLSGLTRRRSCFRDRRFA